MKTEPTPIVVRWTQDHLDRCAAPDKDYVYRFSDEAAAKTQFAAWQKSKDVASVTRKAVK